MTKREYKFKGRWQDILAILLLLIVIVTFVYARVVGSRVDTQNGMMSRRAAPSVMFMDEKLNVEIRLDPGGLPRCSLPPSSSDPVYAVLVLDTSGSMGGAKLDNAKYAAAEFVDLLDMDVDRVGLVEFSDRGRTLSQFSTSRDGIVSGIHLLSTGGSTNMGEGLQKAQAIIQSSSGSIPTNAVRLLVLLSDGEYNVGPDPVAVAEQIRNDTGFRIVAVALEQQDVTYLSPIVGDQNQDIIFAANAAELVNVFGQIAQRYVNILATDIQLTESYNDQAFSIVPGSALGAETSQIGVVRWNWWFMGDRGRNTGYQLRPRTMGVLQVAENPGDISLVTCDEQAVAQALPTGPIVLVLFPLWVLGLLALLGLLWLFYRILEEIRFGRIKGRASPPLPPPNGKRPSPVRPSNRESPTGHWHGRQDI